MRTSNSAKKLLNILAGMILCTGVLGLPAITAAQGTQRQSQTGSFFIISSVDAQKQQIVLKLPTEVTEVVQVTSETVYRNEQGRAIKLEDLRAGDTVYATLKQKAKGSLIVVSIRRGPMTLEELHRRYLPEE